MGFDIPKRQKTSHWELQDLHPAQAPCQDGGASMCKSMILRDLLHKAILTLVALNCHNLLGDVGKNHTISPQEGTKVGYSTIQLINPLITHATFRSNKNMLKHVQAKENGNNAERLQYSRGPDQEGGYFPYGIFLFKLQFFLFLKLFTFFMGN